MVSLDDADLLLKLQNLVKQSIEKPSDIFYLCLFKDNYFWVDENNVPSVYVDGSLVGKVLGIPGGGFGIHWSKGNRW